MSYGNRIVLDGLDLHVEYGELFALLGPNGAGKTTTVEILEGHRVRAGGTVTVLGMDPAHPSREFTERVGVVMQSWNDHASWRVGELLNLFAGFYRDSWPVAELMSAVGITDLAGQALASLSGGQRRRVDVALGLVGRPEVLFLDEPTAGFDPEIRRQFHDLIESVTRQGVTVLLTTHDLHEAERLADRIGILTAGRLAACGTARELAAAAGVQPEVRWVEEGRPRIETTGDPSAFLYELQQRHGGPVEGLTVVEPTLEDTYLRLVEAREGASR